MLSVPKKYFFLLIALIIFLFLSFFSTSVVEAKITDEECPRELNAGRLIHNKTQYDECVEIWSQLSSQKAETITTLKTELSRFDASIALATAQIYTTVAE